MFLESILKKSYQLEVENSGIDRANGSINCNRYLQQFFWGERGIQHVRFPTPDNIENIFTTREVRVTRIVYNNK